MRRLRLAVASAIFVPALTACTGHADRGPEPHWQAVSLPAPPGPAGRLAVRQATRCGGAWYLVGGVFLAEPTADQDSRPAAWRSTDGRTWSPVPITATTYWGQRAILASVACSGDRITAVGARSGGAHGNPRVTTFAQEGTAGTTGLHDVVAAFSQYGGDKATNVGPIAGGDDGWLITGNRTSGPAVWTSDTGVDFVRHEDTPGLADTDAFTALAQAATWDGSRWVVVGGGNVRGKLNREPVAWTSVDGETWVREDVEGSMDFDDLERPARTEAGVLALGLRGPTFGVWRREDGQWSHTGTFGHVRSDAGGSPFVASLAADANDYWATTSDGARYALWHSTDGDDWTHVDTPAKAPGTAGDHLLSVAADTSVVLLLSDDGDAGRVWIAR
jgi:hypothetical protein